MSRQAGQMTIEGILLLTALVSIALFASKQFNDDQILQKTAAGPWAYTRGMIESGVWTAERNSPEHPNARARHASNAVTSTEEE